MTVTELETVGSGEPEETPRDASGKKIVGKSPSRIAWERLKADRLAVVCALIVLFLFLLGIFAPVICKLWGISPDSAPDGGTPSQWIEFGYPKVGPPFYGFTWEHPLGLAMNTAYDNLARLLYGLRTSLFIATLATLFTTVMGVVYGLVSGFTRGFGDRVLNFVMDIFLAFPFILGALALAPIITGAFSDQPEKLEFAQFIGLLGVLVILGWMTLARLIRGQVLSLREREFVQAAQVIGVPTRRILFKELLPNMVAPIVVSISLSMPAFVAAEAGLSFLGIGLSGTPSLGQTIVRAQPSFDTYPIYLWAPVVTVMVLVVALNLLGDSVRDAFDPKTRR